MNGYKHALVLVQNQIDGNILIPYAHFLQQQLPIKITIGHLFYNITELSGMFDNSTLAMLQNDELKKEKSFSYQLDKKFKHYSVNIQEINIFDELNDLQHFIMTNQIDLLVLGHKNRSLATLTSDAFNIANHLELDMIIKHIKE